MCALIRREFNERVGVEAAVIPVSQKSVGAPRQQRTHQSRRARKAQAQLIMDERHFDVSVPGVSIGARVARQRARRLGIFGGGS